MALSSDEDRMEDNYEPGSESDDWDYSSDGSVSSDTSFLDGSKTKQKIKTRTIREVRTIEAKTSLSRVIHSPGHLDSQQVFKFNNSEAYSCNCSKPPRQDHPCKVLQFFGMRYIILGRNGYLWCPYHAQITPMSEWANHVHDHPNWIHSDKKRECIRMAEHVCDSHNLSPAQTVDDLELPEQIDEPLYTHDRKARNLTFKYQCPFPHCMKWYSKDTRKNSVPWAYVKRHLTAEHSINPLRVDMEYSFEICSWGQTIRISAAGKCHIFFMRDNWDPDRRTRDIDVQAPDISDTISDMPLFDSLRDAQTWPMQLGLVQYAAEINAQEHTVALRSLIERPRCTCMSKSSTFMAKANFLERGLDHIDHAVLEYLQKSVSFLQTRHDLLTKETTSG